MHRPQFIIAVQLHTSRWSLEQFFPSPAIFSCQFFFDSPVDAAVYTIGIYHRYIRLLNRAADYEREIRTNAECSGSPMIFSRINWPNARRKEATPEKSCENDRPARRALFMTGGPGETLIVRDEANSKKEARDRGWKEGGRDGEQE